MNELFKSIYSHFLAEPHNAFYNALSGRLFYGEAPQECTKPYAVYFGVAAVPDNTFTEEIDDISIQFNCYSGLSSAIEAGELLKKCRDLFDGTELTVTGNRDIQLFREFSTPAWKNGDAWITSIEFTLFMQED